MAGECGVRRRSHLPSRSGSSPANAYSLRGVRESLIAFTSPYVRDIILCLHVAIAFALVHHLGPDGQPSFLDRPQTRHWQVL